MTMMSRNDVVTVSLPLRPLSTLIGLKVTASVSIAALSKRNDYVKHVPNGVNMLPIPMKIIMAAMAAAWSDVD